MAETDLTVPHVVYYSDTLEPPGESWTEASWLWCNQLTIGVAPTIDQASLTWLFGTVDGAYLAPLSLVGKYVRIEIPSKSIVWYGYCLKRTRLQGRQETVGDDDLLTYGDERFEVVGLEWFLAREIVNFSIVWEDKRIERAIGFNCGMGNGRGVAYEERANKQPSENQFAANQTSADMWNARTAVDYLLARHNPKNAAGDDSPISFTLNPDAVEMIDWLHPVVQTEGKSVNAVLSEIISKNRGLCWWLEVIEYEGDLLAEVCVESMATSSISLPDGATLPANSSAVTLTDVNLISDGLSVTRDLARRYDKVTVRGARRRAVFTVSYVAENLVAGWRSTDEADYKVALGTDPQENDRYREANKFERVYQCFNIPTTWNGTSNDGNSTPGGSDYACPKLPQGELTPVGAEPVHMPGMRLLPSMPIKLGYDYTDATEPIARDPSLVSPEFFKPFAVIKIADGKFRFAHKINTTGESDGEERLTSYHLHVIDGAPGVQLTGGGKLPHTMAKFTFDPGPDGDDGETETEPEVDWRELRLTVAAEWDAWCEGVYPLTAPTNAPVQHLVVSIGDRARLDWLATGTIYDVEGDSLKTVTTGGALRDDRNLCVQVAQIAHQWYGVERAEVVLNLRRIDNPAPRGSLITAIGSGDATVAVNSVVSQITFNFDAQSTSIMAGFAELDFAGLV